MAEITDVIKLRIDSLEHNRQLVTVLAGGLTAVYTAVGVFSVNQGLLSSSSQVPWSWIDSAWNFFVLAILLSVGATNLCFILAVFLLTDSIHNYSKILEYRQGDLFTNAEGEAILAHQRALVSDDLSYFYVRVGTFFITYNLLLAVVAVATKQIQPMPIHFVLIGLLTCGLAAFFFVVGCYRVSHYKVPEYSLAKAIVRFWNPCRWRDAANRSDRVSAKTIENAKP